MTREPFTLIVGNKNYSSWSLRAWLALRHTGAPFRERVLHLEGEEFDPAVRALSPAGKVPVLRDGDLVIHESLAICEYLAERFPEAALWPADAAARAIARAVSTEMHSGFVALRAHLPMNVRRRVPDRALPGPVREDVDRVLEIWRDCRARFGAGGEFLFSRFTIADCMYAPVVTRFRTYGVEVDAPSRRYMDAVLALPAMREWAAAAEAEAWVVAEDEV